MEVRKNKISILLKDNFWFAIGVFLAIPFWWAISKMASWLMIKSVFTYSEAYRYDEYAGSALFAVLIISLILRIMFVYKHSCISLTKYSIVLNGSSGWLSVDKEILLNDLESITFDRKLTFEQKSGNQTSLTLVPCLYDKESLQGFLEKSHMLGVEIRRA
ncbi:hypothetical protein L4D06_06770 [Enterovibrio makurazakiensis]|uniref:hypothetical protein n=1 Tax=Enterovibrio makurazakiensis TaxID=2910232 RepID=UPI003D1F061A